MRLNHPETIPAHPPPPTPRQSVETLSFTKLVPGTKNSGDRWFKVPSLFCFLMAARADWSTGLGIKGFTAMKHNYSKSIPTSNCPPIPQNLLGVWTDVCPCSWADGHLPASLWWCLTLWPTLKPRGLGALARGLLPPRCSPVLTGGHWCQWGGPWDLRTAGLCCCHVDGGLVTVKATGDSTVHKGAFTLRYPVFRGPGLHPSVIQ